MLKKSIVFILIILITLSPVYSISLFPKQQANIYSTFKIDKVLYDKQYTAQIYVASITSKVIDGFQITVKYEKSIDTINIYNQLDPYSTKQYTFKVNQLNPKSLEIRSITNNNHKLVFSSPITYTFNGNEQQIQEQQQITTIQPEQQQEQPQQLVNEPDYISYTSISKLDNEKNIIYFTKDHISSNRITTNNQGNIEYQANYQPYGNIYTQTGNEKFKFSGKELDSSNLYYFGARYYNSNIGRFTQVDPIFKAEESPYQYANNNPIRYIDPSGKDTNSFVENNIKDAQQWANSHIIPGITSSLVEFQEYAIFQASLPQYDEQVNLAWFGTSMAAGFLKGINTWLGAATLMSASMNKPLGSPVPVTPRLAAIEKSYKGKFSPYTIGAREPAGFVGAIQKSGILPPKIPKTMKLVGDIDLFELRKGTIVEVFGQSGHSRATWVIEKQNQGIRIWNGRNADSYFEISAESITSFRLESGSIQVREGFISTQATTIYPYFAKNGQVLRTGIDTWMDTAYKISISE